jgi:phosphoglycerate dehydrogenase-like enzyme
MAFRVVVNVGASSGLPLLRERFPDGEVVAVAEGDQAAMRAALVSADAVVCGALTSDETSGAERLRLVHVLGAGFDGIAPDALPPGCTLCNVFEHETAISEWALMAMLALTRRLLRYDADLRRGEWHGAVSFEGVPERDLRGATLGLVGVGHIGARTAALAQALGMRTVAVTRRPDPGRAAQLGLEWLGSLDELGRLLRESDFVLLCVPLSDETEGMIGAAELDELGPDGYLLNVGRGALVDEDALYDALAAGRIAGAGIDVWYRYPSGPGDTVLPATRPFWELDNVVMTPHSSGWSESTVQGRWAFIAGQLERLREGEPLRNVVRRG